jgi:hypothetical protein
MKKFSIFISMLLLSCSALFAQMSISASASPPDNSAMLDVKSTEKGFLLPRMSAAQISAISNPANGLQVFCTTDSKMYIYIAVLGQWKEVAYGPGTLTPPFVCGIPVTIIHVTGVVAPVNKTVTYGTVTNIPGETTKCWITSNLGADHQATAVNDATEPSAGWYWQFNRKQGYKHDGTTRTPNTTWINSISENLDWQSTNDPCKLELGTNWRIPTSTEWTNVDANGSWTNWNDPWNSGLKMHAAGCLLGFDSQLANRGSMGFNWSSTGSISTNAWYLFFHSTNSYINDVPKAYALSLRCIRE